MLHYLNSKKCSSKISEIRILTSFQFSHGFKKANVFGKNT